MTIQQVILKRFMINHRIAIPRKHVKDHRYYEACTGDLVRGIELQVFRRVSEATRVVKFTAMKPSNWWEHLKQDRAPQWFLKRWPVQVTIQEFSETVTFRAQALFPELEAFNDAEYKVIYSGELL